MSFTKIEPVPNDKLIKATQLRNADGVPRACSGCDRLLERDEKYVVVKFFNEQSTKRLCRFCILKIHRLAATTDV